MKTQSAIEYLMTYGWAIIVIAVVIGVLYTLGVFNPLTFAAKAQPGSCIVYRPYGAFNPDFATLQGPCTGQIPRYVASFDGQSSYFSYSPNQPPLTPNSVTASGWIYVNGPLTAPSNQLVAEIMPNWGLAVLPQSASQYELEGAIVSGGTVYPIFTPADLNQSRWYFVAETYNASSGKQALYVNGAAVTTSNTLPTGSSLDSGTIGVSFGHGSPFGYFNGYMANFQVYNTSLSPNDMASLYMEGIGGDPIDMPTLIAWWPLNGNCNDYSGNSQNCTVSSLDYVGTWYLSYQAPTV